MDCRLGSQPMPTPVLSPRSRTRLRPCGREQLYGCTRCEQAALAAASRRDCASSSAAPAQPNAIAVPVIKFMPRASGIEPGFGIRDHRKHSCDRSCEEHGLPRKPECGYPPELSEAGSEITQWMPSGCSW